MERLLRIVANENISGTVIERLRAAGHDVLSVKESMRGQTGTAILARVQDEERVLIAQDKGFGELVFRWGLPVSCGVILLRLGGDNSALRRTPKFGHCFCSILPIMLLPSG